MEKYYVSTKTYCHNVGLSSCFRQWRAESHCNKLHGYALQVRLEFLATELDERNWVVDFGSLKGFKGWLENTFDHKCLVAEDDPMFAAFQVMAEDGIIDMVVVKNTGCEAFAALIMECAETWLKDNGYAPRAQIFKVEVSEHGGNSAFVINRGAIVDSKLTALLENVQESINELQEASSTIHFVGDGDDTDTDPDDLEEAKNDGDYK